jgi:general stress protein YciG
MAGTRDGGIKSSLTNIERHGHNFYERIGREGGRKSRGGGFAKDPELARRAGRKGGLKRKETLWNRKQQSLTKSGPAAN